MCPIIAIMGYKQHHMNETGNMEPVKEKKYMLKVTYRP